MLTKDNYFTAFMVHLSAEFSMELLLSLVEFIQFKQAIKGANCSMKGTQQIVTVTTDSIGPQESNIDVDDPFVNIELPDCVPESSIVHNENDSFQIKARKLYEKYIKIGSEYEINIASGLRKQSMDIFESTRDDIICMEAVHTVFDGCCNEMIVLLGYSLTRSVPLCPINTIF